MRLFSKRGRLKTGQQRLQVRLPHVLDLLALPQQLLVAADCALARAAREACNVLLVPEQFFLVQSQLLRRLLCVFSVALMLLEGVH